MSSCYSMAFSIFKPYMSRFDDISAFALLGGIYAAGRSQVPFFLFISSLGAYSNR